MEYEKIQEIMDTIAHRHGADEQGKITVPTDGKESLSDETIGLILEYDNPRGAFQYELDDMARDYSWDHGYPDIKKEVQACLHQEDFEEFEEIIEDDLADTYYFAYPEKNLLESPVKMGITISEAENKEQSLEVSMTLDEAMQIKSLLSPAYEYVRGDITVDCKGQKMNIPLEKVSKCEFKGSGKSENTLGMIKNTGWKGDTFNIEKMKESLGAAIGSARHERDNGKCMEIMVGKMAKLSKGAEARETGTEMLARLCQKNFAAVGVTCPGKEDYDRFIKEKLVAQGKDKPLKVHYKGVEEASKVMCEMLENSVVKMAKKFKTKQNAGPARG